MSILETLNILLFFTHLAALLTCVSVVFYFLSIWVSGRHYSATLFPFHEVELGTKILGVALTSLWLTTLPAVLIESLEPDRYFSSTGIILLGILTLVSSLALYVMLLVQDRITQTPDGATSAGLHAGLRIVAAAQIAVVMALFFLLIPRDFLPSAFSVLNPNEILPEILIIFALLFGLLLATTTILKDNWFNRLDAKR